ncbi:hypothetical protein DH2020_039520 [Rehmannia glutinosa]|uniref:Uncharacterized protein n=1 Tax=Rehmannia glutinosa TaxID=99300 RepID=A0ABR0UWS9_REHGL
MASLDTDVNMVPAGEGSSGAGPSNTNPTPSTKKAKRFEIKKWNAVALWAWGIILWIYASNVRLIKPVRQVRNARLLGVFAIMPSTSTALADGSRRVKFALWITASGSFRSTVTRIFPGIGLRCSHFVQED